MAAFTYAYVSENTVTSTIRRSDGAEFPQDPGNAMYQAWLAWVDNGNVTSPASSPSLSARKAAGKVVVNAQARDACLAITNALGRDALAAAMRFQEAVAYEADGSPDDADYPMLAAEVPGTAATTDLVHDAVLAESLALRTSLGNIEDVRQTARTAIDGCANQAAIDAVIAAIDWTP